MNKRVLKHYRFSKAFAWINRHVRRRRATINRIRALYLRYGLVENGCRLCGQRDFTLVAEGDRYGFDLKKQCCNHCGLIQTYPALSAEFHQEFYNWHYRPLYLNRKKVDYQTLIHEQTHKGKEYLDHLRNNGISDDLKELSVIEIGCSSGGTLNTLKPFVKSTQGCDLDIEAIKYAKNTFNLDVEVATYPSTLPAGKKLFILSHVLEHVYDPTATLKEIRALMNKNDYLFIAVPGINTVAEGNYKHDLRRYFHIAHVTDFTAATLSRLTEQSGFTRMAIDEEINGLFKATDKPGNSPVSDSDPISNIQRIEKTYRGHFPHL